MGNYSLCSFPVVRPPRGARQGVGKRRFQVHLWITRDLRAQRSQCWHGGGCSTQPQSNNTLTSSFGAESLAPGVHGCVCFPGLFRFAGATGRWCRLSNVRLNGGGPEPTRGRLMVSVGPATWSYWVARRKRACGARDVVLLCCTHRLISRPLELGPVNRVWGPGCGRLLPPKGGHPGMTGVQVRDAREAAPRPGCAVRHVRRVP